MAKSNVRKRFKERMKEVQKTAPAPRRKRKERVSYKMLSGRSAKAVILESAVDLTVMILKYRRTTKPKKTKNYEVEPYSYRWRKSKKTKRNRRTFFAYDLKDNRIKGFYVKSIQGAKRTTKIFTPREGWDVEIGQK